MQQILTFRIPNACKTFSHSLSIVRFFKNSWLWPHSRELQGRHHTNMWHWTQETSGWSFISSWTGHQNAHRHIHMQTATWVLEIVRIFSKIGGGMKSTLMHNPKNMSDTCRTISLKVNIQYQLESQSVISQSVGAVFIELNISLHILDIRLRGWVMWLNEMNHDNHRTKCYNVPRYPEGLWQLNSNQHKSLIKLWLSKQQDS